MKTIWRGEYANIFLSKDYVVLALIEAKNQIFHENFVTISELNQFGYFLQKEFNSQNLDVVITFDNLSREDFDVTGDVIMKSNTCSLNLYLLPIKILNILYDIELITNFFIDLKNEKIEMLKRNINNKPKSKTLI